MHEILTMQKKLTGGEPKLMKIANYIKAIY